MFDPREKIGLFIDGANFYATPTAWFRHRLLVGAGLPETRLWRVGHVLRKGRVTAFTPRDDRSTIDATAASPP